MKTNEAGEVAMNGTGDHIKGKAKEVVGEITDDKDLEREGKRDQAAGKIKDKVEDVKDWVEDKVDAVKNKMKHD